MTPTWIDFARLGRILRIPTEQLSSLKPIKRIQSFGGKEILITPGSSCPTNDGISAAILMSEEKALAQVGITADQIDRVEFKQAFAWQVVARGGRDSSHAATLRNRDPLTER